MSLLKFNLEVCGYFLFQLMSEEPVFTQINSEILYTNCLHTKIFVGLKQLDVQDSMLWSIHAVSA